MPNQRPPTRCTSSNLFARLTPAPETGDREAWLAFFLGGVKETSEQVLGAARRILALLDADRRKIEALGKPAALVLRVFQCAQTSPILSIQSAAKSAGVSFPTASQAVAHMQKLGLLPEITRKRRHRLFACDGYAAILNPHFSQLISRRGAGTRACRVETRLDTPCGCDHRVEPRASP